MNAAEVKDALRRRYPATAQVATVSGPKMIVGPWTCIDEIFGIDLLALCCHATPASGGVRGVRYPRVGHEVKVSRGDLRRELLRPQKRTRAVERCHSFFFVVPRGLLTADELAYVEPEWEPSDLERTPCPLSAGPGRPLWSDNPGPCYQGKRQALFIGPLRSPGGWRYHVDVPCEHCKGRGYIEKSRVEREAPILWVPRDVGLIEVDAAGCHVTRPSPVRKDPVPLLDGGRGLHDLVRWVSFRPDPRHAARARSVAA